MAAVRRILPVIYPALATGTSADNIAAISAAILAASTAGGAIVEIPAGDWYVKPSGAGTYILAKSNVVLRIVGTLKVGSTSGNYGRLIGSDAAVSNFTIEGPGCIDQNPTGNTSGVDIQATAGASQVAVKFASVDGLTVRGVRFDKCCGINTVWASGYGCKKIAVDGNTFVWRKGSSSTSSFYDNSAVYLQAEGMRVHGNTFLVDDSATTVFAQYANGAIEIHAPGAVVTDNLIDGYGAFLHVVTPFDSRFTSDVTTDRYDVTVTGNTARRINWGVSLIASDTTSPSVVHAAIRGATIVGNTIDIHQRDHDRVSCYGLYMAGDASNPIEGVTFEANTVRFQSGDTRAVDQWGGTILTIESGVYCYGAGAVRNVKVLGNTIINAPWQGIGLGPTTGEGVTIEHNTVVDCGCNASHPQPSYRSGISAGLGGAPTWTDLVVQHNTIRDTGATLNGLYALAAIATAVTGARLGPNVVRSVAADFPDSIYRVGLVWDEFGGVGSDRGDSNATLTVGSSLEVQRFATNLTANRTVTLSSNMAKNGSHFRVVRTGLGSFTLDVGGLKTIPSATAAWVDVTHDGTAWRLTGYGTL